MQVLNVNKVSLSFGDRKILDNISLNVEEGSKIGIIGVNGAGKTTLLKIISGIYRPDEGKVFFAKNVEPGYLKQEDEEIGSLTVYDAVLDSYSHLISMEEEMRVLEGLINSEKNEDALNSLIKKHSQLSERFKNDGGFEYISRTKGILKGLGFSDDEFSMRVSKLSGGQRTRLMLARLLSTEPGILILDEPTNHLDLKALSWLEGFLNDYKRTIIIVSHDRYFLDKVCTGIFEIEYGGGQYYSGNYTAFCKKKEQEKENRQKLFDNQQKEIKRLEGFIEQQRRWNRERNIIAAESRMKAIDRMEKIEAPSELPEKIRLRIISRLSSGKDVLSAKDLSVSFGTKKIFQNISFEVKRGEKIFIMGANGCGKSTLMKALTARITPSAGTVKFGHNIDIAYYDQELSGLNPENTIYDELLSIEQTVSQTEIRTTLAAFLFKGDDVFKKIGVLSGGEKSRVALAKLILSRPNFLFLDEPTNHLDINSREILEEAVESFEGTLICVSHDRYFIKKLANRIIEFIEDGVDDYNGNYESYVEYRKRAETQSVGESNKEDCTQKNSYFASKEQKAKERKLQKMISDTENRIHVLEERLSKIDEEMGTPEVATDHIRLTMLLDEKNKANQELDELYANWERLQI